jgi:hypothetical protein
MPRLGAIDSFSTGSYSVSRPTAGTMLHGKTTPGTPTTFTIAKASVQPVGEDLTVVPEGRSATDVKVIYTYVELRGGTYPDVITILGEPYEVYRVQGPVDDGRRDPLGRVRRPPGHPGG